MTYVVNLHSIVEIVYLKKDHEFTQKKACELVQHFFSIESFEIAYLPKAEVMEYVTDKVRRRPDILRSEYLWTWKIRDLKNMNMPFLFS